MANIANPLPYITKREYGVLPDLKVKLFENRLNAAKNLYRKDLTCHFGCVNAIEFSNNGELLVSGGDDRRVMVWQFGKAILDKGQPEQMNTIHQSNIFCLGITDDHKKIYSGGNDDVVLVHDLESKRPLEVLSHQRAVCCLSIDPYNDRVVTTAGNDGRLLLFDTRQSVHESLVIARSRKAFHGVMFHPMQQGMLVSANARDGLALWDLKAPKHPVIRYSDNYGSVQNCMSVRFNSVGTHILALRRRLAPVLYALQSADPVAEFYHQDYYNSCTMKSCSFAGEGDRYVLSGSDDFNLYLWKVPEVGNVDMVVESPHLVLNGHRSIVNQVRFNPQYSLIASSGVEKIIKLWSTMEYPGMRGALIEETAGVDNPREIYSHDDYMTLVQHGGPMTSMTQSYVERSTREDPCMMAFFDSLVQRELECLAKSESCESGSDTVAQPSSSEEEEIVSDFMSFVLPPKRSQPHRSQRCPNRLSRPAASRYPKNSHSQKRGSLRRPKHMDRRMLLSKFKMLPATRASGKGARSRSAGRVRRTARGGAPPPHPHTRGGAPPPHPHTRGGAPPPAATSAAHGDQTSSGCSDSDDPMGPFFGRKLLRRRAKLSGAVNTNDTTATTSNYPSVIDLRSEMAQDTDDTMNVSNDDDDFEENISIPSTSTGYRGQSATGLLRITEVDSDDDQSVGSRQIDIGLPSRNNDFFRHFFNFPHMPATNGSQDTLGYSLESTRDSLIVEPPESDSTPPRERRARRVRRTGRISPEERSDSNESPPPNFSERASTSAAERLSESPEPRFERYIARLRNEVYESEPDTTSSEGSVKMKHTRDSLGLETPENEGTAVTYYPINTPTRNSQPGVVNVADDQDWKAVHFGQRVIKPRRNYRTHVDSDSD